ncbi:MAG: PIN domain-containing protein [Chloroflexi bacterium]|nr:PIN domain-containing protein [Chloroflexota bacterium]
MAARFLDTNILIRYLTKDDPAKAQEALTLLTRVERGEEKVVISPMVVFEVVFTLQRRYRVPRELIRESLQDIVSLRGIELANKQLFRSALDLYARHAISFADAYNSAYMQSRRLVEIYSWDTDFDKIEGLVRVEPKEGKEPPPFDDGYS